MVIICGSPRKRFRSFLEKILANAATGGPVRRGVPIRIAFNTRTGRLISAYRAHLIETDLCRGDDIYPREFRGRAAPELHV